MIELRKATNYKNYELIEKLAREILPEAYESIIHIDHIHFLIEKSHAATAIDAQVSNKNYEYYLISNNEALVGYLGIEFIQDTIVISKLYILKSYRRKGIGAFVMSFLHELALELTVSKIQLTVHKLNQASIDFYSRQGYLITDSLIHQFENGHVLEGFQLTKVIQKD